MEDFSFPSVEPHQDHDSHGLHHHLPFPHFTTSPLWYLPSVAPLEISPQYSRFHRSLSGSAKDINNSKNNINANDEEKMDMLWENFNEELARASHDESDDIHEPTNINGPLVHHRNPSFILFIKVIRKLLFLRKIGAKRRSSSSSSSVC